MFDRRPLRRFVQRADGVEFAVALKSADAELDAPLLAVFVQKEERFSVTDMARRRVCEKLGEKAIENAVQARRQQFLERLAAQFFGAIAAGQLDSRGGERDHTRARHHDHRVVRGAQRCLGERGGGYHSATLQNGAAKEKLKRTLVVVGDANVVASATHCTRDLHRARGRIGQKSGDHSADHHEQSKFKHVTDPSSQR